MKKVNFLEEGRFNDLSFRSFLIHDSPYFKILNFNFRAGQSMPLHSHQLEGQVSILVVEGQGEFLGDNGVALPAKVGDVLICDIAVPHGIRAMTDMRVLVTIAPPI